MIENHAQRGDIRLAVNVAPDLPDMQGDTHQLRQIFTNLITNAYEALGKFGRDLVQAALQLAALVEGQHAGVAERHGPRLGEAHVVRPEAEVDADAPVDRLEQRRGAAGEAAPPELVRAARLAHAEAPASSDALAGNFASPDAAGRSPTAGSCSVNDCRALSSWSLIARTRCDSPYRRM